MKMSFLAKMYHRYGEHPGKMLVHTGTIGWALSCAAQTLAIATNSKIDKKQKAYLIPQEIGDGLINILSFYALTSSFTKICSKLVSMGKISNKAISNFLHKNNLTNKIGKIDFNIEELSNYAEIKPEYKSFKNGTDIIASTVGSVISCNLVTPVLRNKFANSQSHVLREEMDKINKENPDQTPVKPYDYYKNSMATYLNHSGGMRI